MALASINGNQNNFIHAYILDNYSYIVYNFIKNGGQLTEKDNCPFKGFDLKKLWNESEQRGLPKFQNPVKPNFKNIKQYTRLTIICDDPKVVHQIIRGIQFEICYGSLCFEGSQANRKQFLQNCMQLAKVTKGKNIILSSEVTNSIYQRTPLDCIQMALMFGIPQREALQVMSKNSQMAFKHAHMRKTYKGVAELIIKQGEEEEEEKMQD
eukprot:403368194